MATSTSSSLLTGSKTTTWSQASLYFFSTALLLVSQVAGAFSITPLAGSAEEEKPVKPHQDTHVLCEASPQSVYPVRGDGLITEIHSKHAGLRCGMALAETCKRRTSLSPPRAAQARVMVSLSFSSDGAHHHGSDSAATPQDVALTQERHGCANCPAQITLAHRRRRVSAGGAGVLAMTSTHSTGDLAQRKQHGGGAVDAVTAYAEAIPVHLFPNSLCHTMWQENGTADMEDHVGDKRSTTRDGVSKTSRWLWGGSDPVDSGGDGHQRGFACGEGKPCCQGVLVLFAQPHDSGRSLVVTLQLDSVTSGMEQHSMKSRTDEGFEALARDNAEISMLTTQLEEELRRRCLVANGRNSEEALMKALFEGRLRQDCLIVAADVGNAILGYQCSAKRIVAVITFFVSTLYCVFFWLLSSKS